MILELSDQDNVALEEISKILERHPDLKLIEMVVEPTLIFNHLIIDTGKRKVYYNQQEVLLTTKEYELLYRLALYEGRVLSYRQLYEGVWGEDPMGNEANAVSCHVYGLRRKFREIALSFVNPIGSSKLFSEFRIVRDWFKPDFPIILKIRFA